MLKRNFYFVVRVWCRRK